MLQATVQLLLAVILYAPEHAGHIGGYLYYMQAAGSINGNAQGRNPELQVSFGVAK